MTIILLQKDFIQNLKKWIQNNIRNHIDCDSYLKELKSFGISELEALGFINWVAQDMKEKCLANLYLGEAMNRVYGTKEEVVTSYICPKIF